MKFFNKAIPYRLTQPVPQFMPSGAMGGESYKVHEKLNEELNKRHARVPGLQELSTYGFCEPYPNPYRTLADVNQDPSLEDTLDEPVFLPRLVRPINNGEFLVICAEQMYRQLPGAVVSRELRMKTERIEKEQLRKVYKKERDQLKDEVVADLLPKAFVMSRKTYAIIDTQEGIIWVQAQSHKPAEALLSTLREVLGSLPVRPITAKIAPSATFTDWVRDQSPASDFSLLDAVLMIDTHEDGGKIGAVRQDLTSDEIANHIKAGKLVQKIAVAYEDKLGFMVDDRLVFSRLWFQDLLKEQAEKDAGEDDITALHDASYLLMGRTLRDMFNALLASVGGENVPEGI